MAVAQSSTEDTQSLGSVLRAIFARLAGQPAYDAGRRQLELACQAPQLTIATAAACGRFLLDVGLLGEAETLYCALARCFETQPPGLVGLAQVAAKRRLWTEALDRWDEVLARFDQANPFWQAGRAAALAELDYLDESEDILRRLAGDFETQPPGFVGMAQVAMHRHLWTEALARWDDVFTRFGDQANPSWHASRATALLQLGQGEEAEAVFRRLTKTNPELLNALLGLLQALIATGKPEQALLELHSSAFASIENPALIEKRFEILIRLKRLGSARTEFERILRTAQEPALLETLFHFTPRLYEGWRRTENWLTLLGNADNLSAQLRPERAAPLNALKLRIYLALRDYERFVAAIDGVKDHRRLGTHRRRLLAVTATLRDASFPDYQKPKIFGIGLSKTGTTSLAAALTTLGFNTLDFLNSLTNELMSEDDLHLFDAFTDTPVCTNFEKYYYLFPNAKFIYTTRPMESWAKSLTKYFGRFLGHADFRELKRMMARRDTFNYGKGFSSLHYALYFNHPSYEEAYQAYDRRVRRFFQDKPKDRFMKFDVFAGQGWPELCAFTGQAIPSIPFPWENRKPSESQRATI